jgi:hypothetical protein
MSTTPTTTTAPDATASTTTPVTGTDTTPATASPTRSADAVPVTATPTTTTAADRRHAAEDRLRAALRHQPGATAAELATAADIGRSTTAKILAAWAADGTATSTPGATPRAARRWTATPNDDTPTADTTPTDTGADSAAGAGADADRPADTANGEDSESLDAGAPDTGPRDTESDEGEPEVGAKPAPDAADDDAADDDAGDDSQADGAESSLADAREDVAESREEPGRSPDDDCAAPAAPDNATEPATGATSGMREAGARAGEADQSGEADTVGEDGADNGPEPVEPESSPVRRARRLRPGVLRGMVEDYLREHPGEHGPTEIGHALGRSSGAIANALEALLEAGTAERTSEAPRRYCHADHADGIGERTGAGNPRDASTRRRAGLGRGVSGVGTWVTVLAVVPSAATDGADTTDEITAWLRARLPEPVMFAAAAHGVTRAALAAGARPAEWAADSRADSPADTAADTAAPGASTADAPVP